MLIQVTLKAAQLVVVTKSVHPEGPGVEVKLGKIGVEALHRAIVIMMMKAMRKRWWKTILGG